MNANGLLDVESDISEQLRKEEKDHQGNSSLNRGFWVFQIVQKIFQEKGLKINVHQKLKLTRRDYRDIPVQQIGRTWRKQLKTSKS